LNGRLAAGGLRLAAFVAIVLLGIGSLAFDLTLGFRLPSDADWAEAAGTLRARAQPGDAVQIWPVWAERARLFVDAMPVLAEEDLGNADFVGVQRLWVLSLPRTPFFSSPEPIFAARGFTPLFEEQRFGALALRAFDLHPRPIAADLTGTGEEHEVDYVARRCRRVPIGSRFSARASGNELHVEAGVIGERAYDAQRPPVDVRILSDGAPIGDLAIPRTGRDGTGWRRLDLPIPPGDHELTFVIASPDAGRPFCLQAWTTR
jgi:hypothetical protein